MTRSYSQRGFEIYDDIETDYGDVVSVYESSAASGPHVWLNIAGDCHLKGPPRPLAGVPHGIADGRVSAHLSVEQAEKVIAALANFVEHNRFSDDP